MNNEQIIIAVLIVYFLVDFYYSYRRNCIQDRQLLLLSNEFAKQNKILTKLQENSKKLLALFGDQQESVSLLTQKNSLLTGRLNDLSS